MSPRRRRLRPRSEIVASRSEKNALAMVDQSSPGDAESYIGFKAKLDTIKPIYIPSSAPLSCPGLTGASSTPRLIDSSRSVSGILDRPVKPGDDTSRGGNPA